MFLCDELSKLMKPHNIVVLRWKIQFSFGIYICYSFLKSSQDGSLSACYMMMDLLLSCPSSYGVHWDSCLFKVLYYFVSVLFNINKPLRITSGCCQSSFSLLALFMCRMPLRSVFKTLSYIYHLWAQGLPGTKHFNPSEKNNSQAD